jgi:hypothetical protein
MLRRAFRNTLAALPRALTSERLFRSHNAPSPATETIKQEGDMWFRYYVYAAGRSVSVMGTEWSRKHSISEMDLTSLSNTEARQVLTRVERYAHSSLSHLRLTPIDIQETRINWYDAQRNVFTIP